MRSSLPVLLFSSATLLPIAFSAPAPDPLRLSTGLAIGGAALLASSNSNRHTDSSEAPSDSGTTCTFDSSNPAPAQWYTADPAWVPSTIVCLEQLNNDNYNGYECLPNNGNGTVLGGTSFGFWKGESHFDKGAQACYDACSDCLNGAIRAGQAQPQTRCDSWFKTKIALGPAKKTHRCTMGFDRQDPAPA